MARTGRRPGNVDTRQLILDVARAQFAEQGYDAVSLRGVARAAGVDPALVHHYFDGKSGLFAEVMHLPLDPSSVLPLLLAGDREELGERIIFFLGLWDSPVTGPRMAAAFRAAISTEEESLRLGTFAVREIMQRVAAQLGVDRPLLRASLTGSQLVGIAVVRYLIRAEPLVAASTEQIVTAAAPTLQRYLTGELPENLVSESARG
jgi:AcrR family transcriptional regulator